MTSNEEDHGDRQLKDGKWEKADILNQGADVEKTLEKQGWNEFFTIGNELADLSIKTWRGPDGYLLRFADVNQFSPFVQVANLPELMDLLAKWAPVVQASAISEFVGSAYCDGFDDDGTVEQIAAKWAYGMGPVRAKMETQKQQREDEARRKRQQRGQGLI